MSTQHVREFTAVIDDPATREQVQQAVDDLDTIDATNYAIDHGVRPPTDEPGWIMCQRFDADGNEGPLVWVLVTETDN